MYQVGMFTFDIYNLIGNQPVNRLVPFLISGKESQILYEIVYVDKITMDEDSEILYSESGVYVIKKKDILQIYHTYDNIPYALVEELTSEHSRITLLTESQRISMHHYVIPDLLHIERQLIKYNSFVLHSSYIAVEDGAILFTAPSGGGKTTQSNLWVENKNAEIINGDKSIVGKEDGQWKVYGLPFSGSSEYCKNKTYPLKAIVILDKGLENRFIEVGIHGFSKIFSQITVNPWDESFCGKAMDLVMSACSEVPIYYYSCTKTKDAVDVLYDEFVKKGVLNGSIK